MMDLKMDIFMEPEFAFNEFMGRAGGSKPIPHRDE